MTKRNSTGKCRTCGHPERARIELALANGVDASRVARQFFAGDKAARFAVRRHWIKHVTAAKKDSLRLVGLSDPKVDLDKLKTIEAESLLQNLVYERARLQRIADASEAVGNFQDATRSSTALVRLLELTAKYLGELRVGHTTINNNLLLSPDWVQLRRIIVTALRPYPEAQRAVVAAVREYEAGSGVEVSARHAIELPALRHAEAEGAAC